MVSLIQEKGKHANSLIELSLKIIVRLGIVRSNAEDFLIAVSLINQDNSLATIVDLRDEVKSIPIKGVASAK